MGAYLQEILQADDELLFLLEKRIIESLKEGDIEGAKRKNHQYNEIKEQRLFLMKGVRV